MLEEVGQGVLGRGRALSERFWDRLTPPLREPRDGERADDEALRARLVVGVILLCGFNLAFTAGVQTILGNDGFARSMALLLPVALALVLAIRAGFALDPIAHATVAGIYAATLSIAVTTGGVVAGGLFFLVLVPAIATLIIDRRTGLVWAGVTLATLIGIDLYAGPAGLQPLIELDIPDTSAANLRAAGLVLLAVTAMAAFFSHLQERARSELERLVGVHQQGERRFRAITERAGDLISELDAEGRFVFASPGFEEALGWSPEELIGSRASDRLHPEDRATAAAAWRVLEEKGTVRQEPVRLQSGSGQTRWFEISMRAYSAANDETRVVSIARDVTERLERERLLRRQQRLAAGGIMAAGAAHQLANPMASIIAAAQYTKRLEGGPEFAGEALGALDAIEEEASRGARVLASMLAFARDEAAERWVEDLKSVLWRAARAVQSQLDEAGVELVLSVTDSDMRAKVSPIEVEQVIVSLVRNSIQSGASVVVLGLDSGPESMARITVSDDGPGLDETSAVHAFRAFYTSREGEGVGLGLTVAREIVLAHGGEISLAHSGVDGAVFRVDLPLYRLEH